MVLQKIASSTARATSGIRTMSAAGEGQQHGVVASYGSWTASRTQEGSARAHRVAAASEFLNRKVQPQPEPACQPAPLQDHALPSDASRGSCTTLTSYLPY